MLKSELVRKNEFIWQDKKCFGTAFTCYFRLRNCVSVLHSLTPLNSSFAGESNVADKAKPLLSKFNGRLDERRRTKSSEQILKSKLVRIKELIWQDKQRFGTDWKLCISIVSFPHKQYSH
jgi:hypothetical protein